MGSGLGGWGVVHEMYLDQVERSRNVLGSCPGVKQKSRKVLGSCSGIRKGVWVKSRGQESCFDQVKGSKERGWNWKTQRGRESIGVKTMGQGSVWIKAWCQERCWDQVQR